MDITSYGLSTFIIVKNLLFVYRLCIEFVRYNLKALFPVILCVQYTFHGPSVSVGCENLILKWEMCCISFSFKQ